MDTNNKESYKRANKIDELIKKDLNWISDGLFFTNHIPEKDTIHLLNYLRVIESTIQICKGHIQSKFVRSNKYIEDTDDVSNIVVSHKMTIVRDSLCVKLKVL